MPLLRLVLLLRNLQKLRNLRLLHRLRPLLQRLLLLLRLQRVEAVGLLLKHLGEQRPQRRRKNATGQLSDVGGD